MHNSFCCCCCSKDDVWWWRMVMTLKWMFIGKSKCLSYCVRLLRAVDKIWNWFSMFKSCKFSSNYNFMTPFIRLQHVLAPLTIRFNLQAGCAYHIVQHYPAAVLPRCSLTVSNSFLPQNRFCFDFSYGKGRYQAKVERCKITVCTVKRKT